MANLFLDWVGRLVPGSGVINIYAPPGMRFGAINVQEGEEVETNQVLATVKKLILAGGRDRELRLAELELATACLDQTFSLVMQEKRIANLNDEN
ncbi:MAG: hypothetical protein GKR87_11055 [Kiritimatiellae bacterium]|nr:hypothetical protein [Kiritimatiellia bacterium]